ncbi:MAG: hypothetical protein JSR83_02315 [Proteobacteria bacterium]|nr:hypothetical protein [Pseudomonadota bacterium]
MIEIEISAAHNAARLAGSRAALLSGSGQAVIRLYDGDPASGGDTPTGNMIAEAAIAAAEIVGGQLVVTVSATPIIVMYTGTPTWARFIGADGNWWMNGLAADAPGPGVLVVLATPGPYYLGGRIAIDSAVIG